MGSDVPLYHAALLSQRCPSTGTAGGQVFARQERRLPGAVGVGQDLPKEQGGAGRELAPRDASSQFPEIPGPST